MTDPVEAIGRVKGTHDDKSINDRYPDNVGHAESGGQHYMLIKSYTMDDPRMTTGQQSMTSGTKSTQVGGQAGGQWKLGQIDRSPDWTCALYIPPGSLKQGFEGKYSTLQQGASMIRAAGAAADLGRGMSNMTANIKEGSAGGFLNFMSAVGGELSATGKNIQAGLDKITSWAAVKEAGSAVAGAAMGNLGAAGKQAMATAGIVNNQHMALVYDGPGEFRTHAFSFTFWPKTHESANSVAKIIKSFQRRMLPGGSATVQGISSEFWGYPNMFTIDFFINGNIWSPMQIHRSVLKNMSVDYMGAQGTVAFHKGSGANNSHPVATKLDLTFQETIHVTNKAISEGAH